MRVTSKTNYQAVSLVIAVTSLIVFPDSIAYAQGTATTSAGGASGAGPGGPAFGTFLLPALMLFVVGPLSVLLGTNVVANFKPRYVTALWTFCLVAVVAVALSFPIIAVNGASFIGQALTIFFIAFPIIGAFVFGRFLKVADESAAENGSALGAKRGGLVALISLAVLGVIFFVGNLL
jgi:hypothetical protein